MSSTLPFVYSIFETKLQWTYWENWFRMTTLDKCQQTEKYTDCYFWNILYSLVSIGKSKTSTSRSLCKHAYHETRNIGNNFRELTLCSNLANKICCLALVRSNSRNIILGEMQSLVIQTVHKIANSSTLCIDKDSNLVLKWKSGKFFYAFYYWFENTT